MFRPITKRWENQFCGPLFLLYSCLYPVEGNHLVGVVGRLPALAAPGLDALGFGASFKIIPVVRQAVAPVVVDDVFISRSVSLCVRSIMFVVVNSFLFYSSQILSVM